MPPNYFLLSIRACGLLVAFAVVFSAVAQDRGHGFPFAVPGARTDSNLPLPAKPTRLVAEPKSAEQPVFKQEITDRALASSVRIRMIRSDAVIAMGSGTVIDSREAESLILTCGHLFRDYIPGTDRLMVDYFGVGEKVQAEFEAVVLGYEMGEKPDLGVISVHNKEKGLLATSRLVSKGVQVNWKEAVFSVGCGKGAIPPKLEGSQVAGINKYLGPHNIVCVGAPIGGRSGGGLFNEKGQLIGVTNAAVPQDDEGLYCGYRAIHDFLDKKLKPDWKKLLLEESK